MYITIFIFTFANTSCQMIINYMKKNYKIQENIRVSYASPPIWKLYPCGVKHTSPPSTVATFLVTRLMVVLQPSGYSVFHNRDTPIQLGLP